MYSRIVANSQPLPVAPNLLYVQQALQDNFTPILAINKQPILDVREYQQEYNDNVRRLISNILNKEIPFRPTNDIHTCESCPYAPFCC